MLKMKNPLSSMLKSRIPDKRPGFCIRRHERKLVQCFINLKVILYNELTTKFKQSKFDIKASVVNHRRWYRSLNYGTFFMPIYFYGSLFFF